MSSGPGAGGGGAAHAYALDHGRNATRTAAPAERPNARHAGAIGNALPDVLLEAGFLLLLVLHVRLGTRAHTVDAPLPVHNQRTKALPAFEAKGVSRRSYLGILQHTWV